MISHVNLKQTGRGWEFESETALEDFVWNNLEQLLGLIPLKRQYFVQGQKCDILAINKYGRLAVLELKNTEDRYIVQQLTRYCDALLAEKPFRREVDYTKAISLITIVPRFHKHSLIDRKHHRLSFQFIQFEFLQNKKELPLGKGFYFGKNPLLQLKDIDCEQIISQVEVQCE